MKNIILLQMKDIYKEFQLLSHDYLLLMSKMSTRAKINKQVENDLSRLDLFYEGVKNFIDQYETQLHSLKLEVINANTRVKIVERIHMESFNRSLLKDIGRRRPTPKEWDSIKQRHAKGTKLMEITKHFELTKSQIIELADG